MTEMEREGHAPHVGQHSWAPLIIGVGILFFNAGFVFGIGVAIFGLIIFAAGVATWIREDMRIYEQGSDDGEHH